MNIKHPVSIMKWTYGEWNAALDAGKIITVPDQAKGFLMIGQCMNVIVEYDKKIYRACAWGYPFERRVELVEVEVENGHSDSGCKKCDIPPRLH